VSNDIAGQRPVLENQRRIDYAILEKSNKKGSEFNDNAKRVQ
jgi:hypothetical protein